MRGFPFSSDLARNGMSEEGKVAKAADPPAKVLQAAGSRLVPAPSESNGRSVHAAMDSRARSLAKGVTWRIVATLTTIAIAWLVTGDVSAALSIGFIEVFAKVAIYYLHERAWAHVRIGRPTI